MAGQSSAKGNPAVHRMGNKNHAATRERSFHRGLDRKAQRREEQLSSARFNKSSAASTPWQIAKDKRAAKRHQLRKIHAMASGGKS